MKNQNRFLFAILICCEAAGQNISTIAGGGPRNIPAIQTGLAQPSGIAIDSAGSLYVALAQIHQVWKIDQSGQANLFAGNGSYPFRSDGIPAVSATLHQPQGLAFDSAGNLYIADSGHNRIRRVSPAGVIATVAGNGSPGFAGDGGAAIDAQLNNPVAVALDASGNLYIADKNNHRIRLVSSGTISTFAGTGTPAFSGDGGPAANASLNGPNAVAVDSAGTVYIADSLNFRVRKVIAGTIATAAGTGTSGYTGDGGGATAAQLNTINGLAIDRVNQLYIVEASDIRLLPSGSANIRTFAGGATAGYSGDGASPTVAMFRNIAGVAFDSSQNAYILDSGNFRIRKASATTVTTFAGNGTLDMNGNGLAATSASFLTPSAVAASDSGTLLFADAGSSSIRSLTLSSGQLAMAAGSGSPGSSTDGSSLSGPAANPFGVIFDSAGNFFFIEGNRIRKAVAGTYSTVANTANTAGFSGDGGSATAAQFRFPSALALASNGNLYIADSLNHRVRVIDGATGVVTTVAGNGTAASTGDGGAAGSASLNYPSSVSLDGAGRLYIGELFGNRIRQVNLSTNVISTVAGDGTKNFADGVAATATGLFAPSSVFADQSSNLFIADQGHSRVRRVAAGTGVISTVAGNGAYDFSGDGGPATAAAVNPLGVTVDRNQNLYIADSSGRIRTAPVTACFFTFSTPTQYFNSSGGVRSMTVTATNPTCPYTVARSSPFVTITGGASGTGSGTVTFSVAADPGANRTATVSVGGATFTVQQAGAIGPVSVGFFQSSGGPIWALDANGNGVFDGLNGDKYFSFAGQSGVKAVTGDWNGDGRTKVGYYSNGFWVLDYNGNGQYDGTGPGGDKIYAFGGGDATFVPMTGDWNGDGRTKIGYFRNGFWVLDLDGDGGFGSADAVYGFGGTPGETPIVGDWNGDKRSKIGVFSEGTWILDYNGDGIFNAQDRYYRFPFSAGDKPISGDWSGDGKTKIGVFRGGFWILDYNGNGGYDGVGVGGDKFYGFGGNAGDIPIVADWNGDGKTKIGFYNSGFWTLDFNGNGMFDGIGAGADRIVAYGGTAGNQLLLGRW